MKRHIAAAVAAIAFAVTAPVALAQTAPGADAAPAVTSPRGNAVGPGMMNGQAQAPTQGVGPGMMYGQGQGQAPTQGGVGPGMTYGQGQGNYGPGMMNGYGYGAGWMGGYGGLWLVILLVVVVGAVTWIVVQKRK